MRLGSGGGEEGGQRHRMGETPEARGEGRLWGPGGRGEMSGNSRKSGPL